MAKKFNAGSTKTKIKLQLNNSPLSINITQHNDILSHIQDRLNFQLICSLRNKQIDRFSKIDRELAAYLVLDKEDQKRESDNQKGFGPKPTNTSLPLILTQLDEALTYLMSVIAPEEGIYQAITTADKQEIAQSFALLMNKHAEVFKHYRHIARGLFDSYKYNFGGWTVDWTKIFGNKIKNASGEGVEIKKELIFSGNELLSIDPYNFIYDSSVDPIDLNKQGEFFAIPKIHTKFQIQRMAENKEIFNLEKLKSLSSAFSSSPQSFSASTSTSPFPYYRLRPELSTNSFGGKSQELNWVNVLLGQEKSVIDNKKSGLFEITSIYSWLNPIDFDLSDDDELQIWRFDILNNKLIIFGEQQINAHGMLPCAICMPWDDGFKEESKSYAEYLVPFQRFSSFQLNVHQNASRKALYGLTLFNKRIASAFELDDVDLLAGKIGVDLPIEVPIRNLIEQLTDVPDTQNTLNDIQTMDGIMQKILPTDIIRQVTDLERATQYQAAAAVQGSNRRNLKIAKLLNDQAINDVKQMQMFNILQFQDILKLIDKSTGQEIEVNPREFRDANIEFVISAGLKGLDRLMLISTYKDMSQLVLQSRQAFEQLDIVKWLDHWASIVGDKTDFDQFRLRSQIDALPVEMKNLAFQLLQQFQQSQQSQSQQSQQPQQQTTLPTLREFRF